MITCFWEDAPNQGDIKNYGPHKLLVQCLVDDGANSELRYDGRVRSHPCKGNSKLVAEIARRPSTRPLVGILDRDRVHDLLDLPKDACLTRIKASLVERAAGTSARWVLLTHNIETVIQDLRQLRPDLVAEEVWGRALAKKLNSRDAVLAAASTAHQGELRKSLRQRNVSFDYLVRAVSQLLRASETAAPILAATGAEASTEPQAGSAATDEASPTAAATE